MTTRTVPTSASPAPVLGTDYMDAVSEKIGILFDHSCLLLNAISGTNAIVATADPTLTSGLVAGMAFLLIPAVTNTAAVTLAINGGSAVAVKDSAGVALLAGVLVAGTEYQLIYNMAGHYRVLNSTNIQKVTNYQVFTASGIWTKPAGTPNNALVLIQAWGAGGAGGNGASSSGGGGAGYNYRWMRASDITSTVTVTIPTGGATGVMGSAGGNATFGSYLTAYGGGGGTINASGGGGGQGAAGTSAGDGGGPCGTAFDTSNAVGGAGGTSAVNGYEGYFGGGSGGRGGSSGAWGDGGKSVWGGGGGGGNVGANLGNGGTSIFGGNGGVAGSAGSAPGGGGGRNAAGGRGEIRVFVIG